MAPTKLQRIEVKDISPPSQTLSDLALAFAPVVYHDVGVSPKADGVTRFDFDGDFKANNNWENLDKFPLILSAYFEVFSTKTHYFISYSFFHPRDYSRFCVPVICHENDMEGALVTIERETKKVIAIEGLAHNLIKTKRIDQDREIKLYIEASGHGVFPFENQHDPAAFYILKPSKKGEVFEFKNAKSFLYELRPLAELWNLRDDMGKGKVFLDRFDHKGLRYQLNDIPKSFAGEFYAKGLANPPWAWIDVSEKPPLRGHWFFDPALWVYKRLGYPDNFSLEYERHPYLGVPSK